jgi:hypothetical protein
VRSGLIDVGSTEVLCACERLVCVEKAEVRIVFFSLSRSFCGKERSAEAVCGEPLEVLC